jgi:acylphosphatase
MKSLSIRIGGKVQGVFYRASAKDRADELGVNGIVRNEPDGSVYIEAEAEQETLDKFVEWCRKGPARARVMTFVIDEKPRKGYVGFEIQRYRD